MRLILVSISLATVAVFAGLVGQAPERAAADYNISGEWQITIGSNDPCPATISQQHTFVPDSKYYSLTIILTCNSTTNVFSGTIHGATGAFSAAAVSPPAAAVMQGTASVDNHTITGTYCIGLIGGGSCIYTYTLYGTGGDGLPKPTPSPTAVPSAGLALSIGIDTNGDTIDDCHTRPGGPANCSIQNGATFTLNVSLDSLPVAISGYTGFDLWIPIAGVEWNGHADADVWPDCQAETIVPVVYETLEWGCVNTTSASTYTGVIGTARFRCQSDGSLSLRHGPDPAANTHLQDGLVTFFESGPDVLTISCSAGPPSPTATPTPTRPPSVAGVAFDAPSSGASAFDSWSLAAIAGAAFVALGGAALYANARKRASCE